MHLLAALGLARQHVLTLLGELRHSWGSQSDAASPPLPSPYHSFPCSLLPFPPRELCWMRHGITWVATRAARSGQALTCLADTLI